jgi:hypothetical protein
MRGNGFIVRRTLSAICSGRKSVNYHELTVDPARVSLLRWLRRQLAEPAAIREHLEAAVANDDPAEARRLLAGVPFTDAQRRYLEDVLGAWDRQRREPPRVTRA